MWYNRGMNTKGKRIIAVVGLVCMAIFSVSFVIVLANRTLLGGAFGYIALVSGLLGIAALLSVKLFFKEEETPSYLPTASGETDEKENAPAQTEQSAEDEKNEDENA